MPATPAQIERIEQEFARIFARSGIRLPEGAAGRREAGHIFKDGWHVGFIWGEQDGDVYLEYLAQHRMVSGDAHRRLWASGRAEALPTAPAFFVIPRVGGEQARKRAEAEYFAENREISDELRAKGLLPPKGTNQGALEINEALRSGSRPADRGNAQ